MQVIGAGPAGAVAALKARREGADVQVFEKSAFPRQKVCGEFLSPEAALVFADLGILPQFLALKPFAVREAHVTIGRTTKRWKMNQPAFGISRYALDDFLLREARLAGAQVVRESARPGAEPVVVAHGRQNCAPSGTRLFGFKAHFSGPVNDRIDLVFERDVYIGINCVEDGSTNVCGLASEPFLRQFRFEPDALIAAVPSLHERVKPLSRVMDWLITGPLIYGGRFDASMPGNVYLAGDALGFVDPFTGSGMLGALSTGLLAGRACARGIAPATHLLECRKLLGSQYQAAALFRKLIDWGVADKLAWLVPGQKLFDLTRPRMRAAL